MAPKAPARRARAKSPSTKDSFSLEEEAISREAKRLHERSDGILTSCTNPQPEKQLSIPRGLRRCDGSDIVKKSAHRKSKFLFVFPGNLSIPPSALVGELQNLDSRNPSLYITFPKQGVLKLKGTLVFPKNSLLTIKGANAGKAVNVVDTFETLVVFSEWAWIGDKNSNPGEVPIEMPKELQVDVGDLSDLRNMETRSRVMPKKIEEGIDSDVGTRANKFSKARRSSDAENGVTVGENGKLMAGAPPAGRPAKRRRGSALANALEIPPSESSQDDAIVLVDSDDDVILQNSSQSGDADDARPPLRAKSSRERKSIDYSKMFESGDDDDDDDNDEDEAEDESED